MFATPQGPWREHFSPTTRTLNLLLRRVSAPLVRAWRRGAGILFLGDFWHVRASLPVRPLNAAVEEIASWTQPTLMLPGNHDQVRGALTQQRHRLCCIHFRNRHIPWYFLPPGMSCPMESPECTTPGRPLSPWAAQVTEDGKEHALLPLGAVNPRVHVISEPALFLGALWLPYRRDGRIIEAAVRRHAAGVVAIFAHVDVVSSPSHTHSLSCSGSPTSVSALTAPLPTPAALWKEHTLVDTSVLWSPVIQAGAMVNNALQLQEGLSPGVFPAGLPVFTGHYHKPHVVAGTTVEYVGSPFQTSLAEAGQGKRLLLLQAPGWQVRPPVLSVCRLSSRAGCPVG